MLERQAYGTRASRKRDRERKRDLDEANSKRDVLLIILTPGVRLNERKSQTHEAQCKFNYREKGRLERAEGKERHNERKRERTMPILVAASVLDVLLLLLLLLPAMLLYPRAPVYPCTRVDWTR